MIYSVTVPSPGGSVTSAYSSLLHANPDPVRRLSVSELETNHITDTLDSDWARVAGGGREPRHGRAMPELRAQPKVCPKLRCRRCQQSRWRNQSRTGIARRVWVETVVAGFPDRGSPRDVGPPRCPTRTESPGATAGPRCCCSRRGPKRALRQPHMPMTAMVAIPPHSASCRPRHRVTERRVHCTLGSVRGVGSVCHKSYVTISGTMSGTMFDPIWIGTYVCISGTICVPIRPYIRPKTMILIHEHVVSYGSFK
jgi:hypothetical protein